MTEHEMTLLINMVLYLYSFYLGFTSKSFVEACVKWLIFIPFYILIKMLMLLII